MKGQSAIEFLSTYAFVILLVSLVVVILALYLSFPRTVLPNLCTFYSGFTCSDTALSYNGLYGNTRLLVFGTDAQPGILNITSFNAILNYQNSTTSGCTPRQLQAGQAFYCIANFSFTPANSVTYIGTMKITAGYCAPSPNNASVSNCLVTNTIAPNVLVFGGSLRLNPAQLNIPPNVLLNKTAVVYAYLPFTVTNTQNIVTPYGLQVMLTLASTNTVYQKYEESDLGNIRFYQGATELPSWCESNCTSTSTGNSVFWIRLNGQINPFANTTVTMKFLANTIDYDGVYAGESPVKSSSYAQFDNGAAIFSYYTNFEWTTLPAQFLSASATGASVTVNNGLSVNTGAGNYAGVILQTPHASPFLEEAYIASQSGGAQSGGIALQISNAPTGNGYDFNGWAGSIGEGSLQLGMSGGQNIALTVIVPGVNSEAWLSSSSQWYYKNYTLSKGTATVLSLPSQVYSSIGVYCCSGSNLMTVNWFRIRAYPPWGVMPTVTQGGLGLYR